MPTTASRRILTAKAIWHFEHHRFGGFPVLLGRIAFFLFEITPYSARHLLRQVLREMIDEAVSRRMAALGLEEEDIVERFVLGSGSGGQKVNKTSSCVYLKHLPTGQEIKCQQSRSRSKNRLLAREELCDRIEKQHQKAKLERQARRAKKRALSKGRSKSTKRKIRKQKEERASRKQNRRNVRNYE